MLTNSLSVTTKASSHLRGNSVCAVQVSIHKAEGHGLVSVTPNPSIEGMPKRLRLSVTPHVKR